MSDIVRAQGAQVPPLMRTRYRDSGNTTHAKTVDVSDRAARILGKVGVTSIVDPPTLIFRSLKMTVMGEGVPTEAVLANANRRMLIVTNVSDTIGYLSIGNGEGLTTTSYLLRIGMGETLGFLPPISTQAIAAVCCAAVCVLAYQEAT